MKVTAYIQHSNDPKKNLIEFNAIDFNVAGKSGYISVTTTEPIEGIAQDAPEEDGLPRYTFSLEEVVDFKGKDSLPSDKPSPASQLHGPAADALKVRKTYTRKEVVVKKPAKEVKAKKAVSPAKEPKPVAKAVTKKEIKANDAPLPVADVLKNLRQNEIISNRASGTIQAVADKLGLGRLAYFPQPYD